MSDSYRFIVDIKWLEDTYSANVRGLGVIAYSPDKDELMEMVRAAAAQVLTEIKGNGAVPNAVPADFAVPDGTVSITLTA